MLWYFMSSIDLVLWPHCMSSVIKLSQILSSPPPDLCDSLYGLSILASDSCYRLAVLENGNPLSPTGMLQSLDVDLLNGDFLGTPLEWCQTLGHTAAQDSRHLETRPSNSLLRKGGGGFPRRPTADITLFAWLESDVTELKEVRENCTCIYVLVCIVLAVIPVQSIQQK